MVLAVVVVRYERNCYWSKLEVLEQKEPVHP